MVEIDDFFSYVAHFNKVSYIVGNAFVRPIHVLLLHIKIIRNIEI